MTEPTGDRTNTSQTPDAPKAAVSSTKKTSGKTVSFTLPAVPKPKRPRLSSVKKKSLSPRWKSSLLAFGFVASVLLSGYAGAWFQARNDDGINSVTVGDQKKIVTSESKLISQIATNVGPSVVSVNTSVVTQSDDFSFYGFSGGTDVAQGAGTGIILTESGYIVTNRHVVPAGTTKVSVTLSDGTELKDVSVVGRTNETDSLDVAFLKINDAEGKKLQPAAIGDSSSMRVGDNVVAIGNALGQFQNTVTSGILSGFGRSVQAGDGDGTAYENLDNLFQTDAAINQGNSGGPLVNLNGQVIGINTAVAAGDAQNIGFAIPINDVRGLIDQVVEDGSFERPYLGVRYVPLSADVAKEYDLPVEQGAFILPTVDQTSSSIIPNGPAQKAGLREKDIITAVDGKKVDQSHSLTSLLAPHRPGDKVKLSIVRGDQRISITATLGALPSEQ